MRKRLVIVAVSGMSIFAPIAGASASGVAHRYFVRGTGTTVSFNDNQSTFSGTVRGTFIGRGTFSGSSFTTGGRPPCGTGPGSPTTGTVVTTASSGDTLTTTFSGTLCTFASTPTSNTYKLTARFEISGGTGRFAGATGQGTLHATTTLSAAPGGGLEGPLVYEDRGIIRLK
jgi:hypothetical protein